MIETTENKRVYTVGTSPAFAFDLSFFAVEEIHCYVSQGGTAVELQRGVDFSVERKASYEGGATVTLSEQPTQNLPTGLPTGATLAIEREMKLTQELSLPRYGKLPSEELEKQLDKLTMICQQLQSRLARSMVLPPTHTETDETAYSWFLELSENAGRWAEENAGALAKHNASSVAHEKLFRGKISKPTTGSAGQYLKLESDGSCSWANVAGVPIGTIFPYVCKRPPNGAYLLNGQTITNCSTLYPQFWEWINAEVSAGYIRAVADNATFDAELSAKGNCGAFVLNAGGVTGAVRLPLIADGFIMGALSDEQGHTLAAGLPNIQGSFGAKQFTAYGEGWGAGAFYAENPSGDSAGGGNSGKTTVFYLDASRSSSVYGNSTTVQPPAVRFPYCIQVYHATSPLSEQLAAQLASEMQIRADTSLSNLTGNGIRAVRGVFSAQPSGYARLPSGMIIQWGETAGRSQEGSSGVTFPTTFPNACFTVVVGTKIEESVTVPGGCDFTVQLVSKTLKGVMLFWQWNGGGTQKAKATWVAIGY